MQIIPCSNLFFLWKLKLCGAPLGREGLCHLCSPALEKGSISSYSQQRCECGSQLGTGFSRALLFSVTCLSAGNPFFWPNQKGNLNFVKSPAVLTHVGIDRDLLVGDGQVEITCHLCCFSTVLLQCWAQTSCSDQIFSTSALWI